MYLHEWRGEGQPHLRILPFRSLIDAGAIVAASSDYPCASPSPMEGMWSAVTRRSRTGAAVDPEEAVTPLEALRMYTSWAALACGRDGEEGTIEIGKRANLAILDTNPLECSHDVLRNITVVRTYVDGDCRFQRVSATQRGD
jgi:predicted amidohydrolase YtcJ